MSHEKHVYDGIEEHNNPMPDWWIWLFVGTVIFGVLYWLHYEIGGGETSKQRYERLLKAHYESSEKNAQSAIASETEESLMEYMQGESVLANGGQIYTEKCAMCHGPLLEGQIGPNLTDSFWLHGQGTRLDLLQVIRKGVPEKGMPPWEGLLKPAEMKDVAAYVYSKIGSNPPNPKVPEGAEVK
ncbi:cbb3-type cytochrome c oxidase N-terminal domain-containing protein [Pseudobdellovibrio exovorus]|uniref:Cytochrome-c oxidase fixP chain n=1 Tax=Pseudobdellovibrio exovorus JSS TaxID=1184267 RepID=M4VBP1_9BACT|nr:cbb3-type cytochrome c oxidase N-terminal domain-containing protein [Pseudobdellovibrio exovorus]AGH95441.1 cytochrome-c oxidase fixP chain [Pseudobdellovibrio exovorus JSS]